MAHSRKLRCGPASRWMARPHLRRHGSRLRGLQQRWSAGLGGYRPRQPNVRALSKQWRWDLTYDSYPSGIGRVTMKHSGWGITLFGLRQ
jgi:hypothetical protein